MNISKLPQKQTAGFTIVELMIATLVFSVILIVITSGIISLTNQYYKGITSSKTQSEARGLMDAITQDIQLSPTSGLGVVGTQAGGSVSYFCTGTHLYRFVLGQQLVDGPPNGVLHQSNHVLVESQIGGTGCASDPGNFPATMSSNDRELMAPGMRLESLSVQDVTPSGSTSTLWRVNIRVLSGDDDLFVPTPPDATSLCKGGSGGQFCAISELTTTVEQRL